MGTAARIRDRSIELALGAAIICFSSTIILTRWVRGILRGEDVEEEK